MSSIITSIISSSLGLVLNKARHTAADKLKQRGDVTDEQLRNAIVDDLNDIKTKIDGLARKDSLASYSFLKEGIISLNVALDEARDEQISKDEANADQDSGSKKTKTATRNKSQKVSPKFLTKPLNSQPQFRNKISCKSGRIGTISPFFSRNLVNLVKTKFSRNKRNLVEI